MSHPQQPFADRVLRTAHAAAKLGVCTRTLRRWVRSGLLPAPVRFGLKASGWRESELDTWLQKRAEAARRQLSAA